jgi:hypothetical protein
MKNSTKIKFLTLLSVLCLFTFSGIRQSLAFGDDCVNCGNNIETPGDDDIFGELSSAISFMDVCAEQVSDDDPDYKYGPTRMYTEECRNQQRKYSLTSRGLEIGHGEEKFWKIKDKVQEISDKINIEAVKLRLKILDKEYSEIDITKHANIKRLIKIHKKAVAFLKREAARLAKKSRGKRKEAYVEQGMIIDIKKERFETNISSLRTATISNYKMDNDPKVRELVHTLKYTKSPKKRCLPMLIRPLVHQQIQKRTPATT